MLSHRPKFAVILVGTRSAQSVSIISVEWQKNQKIK